MAARTASVILLSLLVAGCMPSTAPSASGEPSPSAASSEARNLPPGCEPIELRAPSGELVVLNGVWREDTASTPMTWWIQTQGDCVWGAGAVGDTPSEGSVSSLPHEIQSLSGRIGPDFVITGEIIWLEPAPFTDYTAWAPLRMLIDFGEAGQISLREDREPGVTGLHCPDPTGYCPAPLVLLPVD